MPNTHRPINTPPPNGRASSRKPTRQRAFVGIGLDPLCNQACDDAIDNVKRACPVGTLSQLRWLKPQNRHLTLVFLGSLAVESLEELGQRLTAEIQSTASALTLTQVGSFPLDKKSSIVAAVANTSPALEHLRREVLLSCERAGIVTDAGDDFAPHITLGRFARRARRALPSLPCRVRLNVNNVTLFLSRQTTEGSQYSVHTRRPLLAPQ